MFNDYNQVVHYLYDALPMFQRIGAAALKADLSNTIRLCQALGNPERKFRSIHVAGTNGKGSVSHMLAAVLQSAGYRTGLYTSPHLKEFTERIRVNGTEAERKYVMDFVNKWRPLIEEVKPSFFEITVVMAFDYFVHRQVDVAVIEVGLGGRLDSTNVITPELSVITNIGLDHRDLLGDNLEKIASEKAGIIKPVVPVVVSERQHEIEHVFTGKAREMDAPLSFASDHFLLKGSLEQSVDVVTENQSVRLANIHLQLKGFYQRKNIPAVILASDKLNEAGFRISDENIRNGLEQVVNLTHLKGRWQTIGESPLTICDTGHNAEGIAEVLAQINAQTFDHLHIVLGFVKDKDVDAVLRLFPKSASYYFCQANIPRAMDAAMLRTKAKEVGLSGLTIVDVNDAIRTARKNASRGDMVFVGGSSFVVAEIENL